MTPIAEMIGVDRARFDAEIRLAARPVVLRGLVDHWPIVADARRSDESLVATLRQAATPMPLSALAGPPEIAGKFGYTPDMRRMNHERGNIALAPFLDRLLAERTNPRPIALAVQSTAIADLLPGLRATMTLPLLDAAVEPRIWIGNAIRVATHNDPSENIACCVAGRRRFTLFPPGQVGNLYPGPFEFTPAGTPISLADPEAPDYARFPRFEAAMAAAESAELGPGDALYIPYHWWHHVASLDPVNVLVNYWWSDARGDSGAPKDALLHALLAIRDLPPQERDAWREMFAHYIFGFGADDADHVPEYARGVLGRASPQRSAAIRAMLKQLTARY